jgi:hypothetical protein
MRSYLRDSLQIHPSAHWSASKTQRGGQKSSKAEPITYGNNNRKIQKHEERSHCDGSQHSREFQSSEIVICRSSFYCVCIRCCGTWVYAPRRNICCIWDILIHCWANGLGGFAIESFFLISLHCRDRGFNGELSLESGRLFVFFLHQCLN